MNERELFTTRNVAIGLAALLIIAFFGPAFGSTTFFYRDFGVLAYPTTSYHREMFWRGELPLWNPYSNCGVPFLAQWGTMVLYPFTLIYLLLPFPWSLNVFCLAHLWFGGLGVFLLARRWTDSSPGAAMAAVLFVFNGITLSTLSWPNYTAAFAWMPWIVLAVGALLGEERRRSAALHNLAENSDAPQTSRSVVECGAPAPLSIARAALAGTMQMLVGAPEIVILTWFLVLLTWILSSPTPKSFARITAVIALIAGLSAIQLLPFFELLSLSQRQTGLVANKWSMPIGGIGNFLLPMLHAFRTPQNTWFQHEQHFLSSTYLGLPAVLLAALGAIYGGRRARILLAASAVCILLALGTNLPTFALIQNIPILGLARYPVKFALLLALTIPLACAFGVKALASKQVSSRALVAGLAIVLTVSLAYLYWALAHPYKYDSRPRTIENTQVRLALYLVVGACLVLWQRRPRPVHLFVIIGLLFFDGRYHLANQNPTTSLQTLKEAIGSRPLPKLGEGRVFISPEAEKKLLNSDIANLDADFIGKQLAVWSHLNLIELVPKVNGSATLQLREQKQIQDWLYSGTNVNLEAWLDFLGVTKITAPNSVVEWTNRVGAKPILQVIEALTDGRSNFETVTSATCNPRETVALDWLSDPPLLGKATAREIVFSTQEIRARVEAESTAAVVVAQSWHPGWKVEVNGRKLWGFEIMRANHAFFAFSVPTGSSSVRIYYRDDYFILGVGISLLSLAVCLWLLLRPRSTRAEKTAPSPH